MQSKNILTSLVGSRAHGLATPTSDRDLRGVYITPTSEILSLGYKEKPVSWLEGQGEDATSYELHHFLNLACHSNPSILEVLVSPVISATPEGFALQELFPYLWNSKNVRDAFIRYGKNQQKKYLDEKDNRPGKYSCAYLRVLILGIELLQFGTMTVSIEEQQAATGIQIATGIDNVSFLKKAKNNEYSKGLIIDYAEQLTLKLQKSYEENPDKQTDFEKINTFLLTTRKSNW